MEKEYYEILGISSTATDQEIKKAYRQMILKYHPDRNKTAEAKEKLSDVEEAYEVLKDENKRDIYDRYGEVGLKELYARNSNTDFKNIFCPDQTLKYSNFLETHGNGTDLNDGIFMYSTPLADNTFSSSSSNLHNKQNKEKVQDPAIIYDLYVSLEDILNGCEKKIKIGKSVQQGDGTIKKEIKILTINVKPGWKAGTKITFHKEGDQEINKIPADIIFIIRDKPHPLFKREGNDIKYTIPISLKEALCGTEVLVPTLTGQHITLDMKSEIINPTTTKLLQGHGLPFFKNPSQTGDMLVTFDIQFPEIFSPTVRDILYDQLPCSN